MNGELIPDIPRLYTALAEWAACFLYIIFLKKRFNAVLHYLLCAAFLALIGVWQYVAGILPLILWVPGMIMAVILMFLFIYTCCEISPLSAAMWCIHAFIVAEFAASFEWQLFFYYYTNFSIGDIELMQILFLLFIYGIVFFTIYLVEKRYMRNKTVLDIRKRDLVIVFSIALTVFIVSNMSFINIKTPFSGRFANEVFYIRTLVDFCGIILLVSQREQKLWLHAKNEVAATHNVLLRQYQNYCQSKENIELINRRYHDLKHQIQIIRSEKNLEKKSKYLDELEECIKLYESQYETGNTVLDTVLTTKSNDFYNNSINFTCVVDGKLLDFIDVMDICSIFGNALDNAIENVSFIKDTEKRLIKLLVYAKNDLLIIRFGNYYENKLQYEDGNLVTTKKDLKNHGYGIKSIKHTVQKYNGSVRISTDNNWFALCILIPINHNKDQITDNR